MGSATTNEAGVATLASVALGAIPADGYGEITLSVAGHVRKFSAKSALPVEAGTEVWVSGILSPTAVEVTQTSGPQELTR